MKKVSVIIPVYNAEKYVADAIKSVLSQTYENIEILIIDDGSPDKSIEVCHNFKDPRIQIIRQKNRGLAGARNTGIRHAQGDYLAFLDADDIWLPEKLEKHVLHLENSSKVGISFSRSAFINESGKDLNIYQMGKLTDIKPSELLYFNPLGNGSSGVFRKEVFEEISFTDDFSGVYECCYFDTSFIMYEDIECWIRIAIKTSWQFEGIPEALTLYRVNPQGLSSNFLAGIDYWEKLDEKVNLYAPQLIDEWKQLAMAHRMRYLAREAVRRQAGSIAIELIERSIAYDWRIIFMEPSQTIVTWVMSYLLWLMPKYLYIKIEALIWKIKGFVQRHKFDQKKSSFLHS
ncbi:MAG: glycosyltransferase family 2 protein [Rivularia sp. (in: cyanobacteria)]